MAEAKDRRREGVVDERRVKAATEGEDRGSEETSVLDEEGTDRETDRRTDLENIGGEECLRGGCFGV